RCGAADDAAPPVLAGPVRVSAIPAHGRRRVRARGYRPVSARRCRREPARGYRRVSARGCRRVRAVDPVAGHAGFPRAASGRGRGEVRAVDAMEPTRWANVTGEAHWAIVWASRGVVKGKPDVMDPGFHGARTPWIRGFMAFQLARLGPLGPAGGARRAGGAR